MKKALSLILALILVFTVAVPALAAGQVEDIPIITLRGDGTQIFVPDENAPDGERNIWGDALSNIEGGDVGESVANVLLPFLTEGLLFDKWDNYYDAFYEETAPIFEELRLDGNGQPRYGSGIGKSDIAENANTRNQNPALWQGGRYTVGNYTYWYDWRLDPEDIIDDLHRYILDVMKTTGKKKITLCGTCFGGAYVLAYLNKYGTDGHIKNVFFNVTVGNSTSLLTDAFCGDIEIDAKAIQRFGYQNVDLDTNTFAGFFASTPLLNEIIFTSYDLLAQTGVIDKLGISFDELYQKIYEGLVPRLAIAMFATFPSYWSLVEPERFEEARDFVFTVAGAGFEQEYAGLIEKINNNYENVTSRKVEIIETCQQAGVHFGALAKYGAQMYPFVESQDQISDELVDLYHASFGATVAKDVYSTFDDAYLAMAEANGTAKYISPDKQIDASTSLFKDSLWILKNGYHDYFVQDYKVIEEFSRNTEFTVNDNPAYPQYMIYIPGSMELDEDGTKNFNTGTVEIMTEENCHLTLWDEMPESSKENEPTLTSRLLALFRWLTAMFKMLTNILSGKSAVE